MSLAVSLGCRDGTNGRNARYGMPIPVEDDARARNAAVAAVREKSKEMV